MRQWRCAQPLLPDLLPVHRVSFHRGAVENETASQFVATSDPRHRHTLPPASSIRHFRRAALSTLRRFFSLVFFALARQRRCSEVQWKTRHNGL